VALVAESGSFGQELFDGLVSFVALTGDDQAGKIEFQSGLHVARRNVITARFQTFRQFLGTCGQRAPNTMDPRPRMVGLDVYSNLIPIRTAIIEFLVAIGYSKGVHIHRVGSFPDGASPTLTLGQISI
jgi:hypothetical protein